MVLGPIFKTLGGLLEKGLGAAGDAGHFIKYATGLTGAELQTARRASFKKVGRILGREEQASARMLNQAATYQERFMRKEGISFAATPRLAENTARYERAYASRQRAINFGLNRLLPAAGFYAAGQIGGAFIENRAEMQRSYRGEESYTAMYGTSAQTAASLVRGAGTILGIQSLLGVNPVQGTIKGVGDYRKFRRANAVYKRAVKREASYAKLGRPVAPGATDPIRQTAGARAARRAEARGGRRRARSERRQQELNIRKEARLASKGPGSRRATEREYLNRGSVVPRSPQRKYAQDRLARADKRRLRHQNFLTGINASPLSYAGLGLAAGVGVIAGADNPYALGITAGIGAIGIAASPVGRFIARNPLESVATAGVLTAGAAVGMSRQHYVAAEGNISDVSYARESPVSKLNYSTAGLVQSIHNNRRRM
jgi:hypothetical protein